MRIPQRQSLVIETYRVLRDSIDTGVWTKTLPGERVLCSQFLISRPTLRQALDLLEEEGVIRNLHGKHRAILTRVKAEPVPKNLTQIGLLCPTPLHEMLGCTSRKVAAIESYVHNKQMSYQLHVKPKCFNQNPGKALSALVEENSVDCWILQQTNLAMQLWFQAHRIPAVISGTRCDGVTLPSVDLDNRSVCRHAVGQLLARKRKAICFVRFNSKLHGDKLFELGFLEGIRQNPKAKGFIVGHNNCPKNICQSIDQVIATNPEIDSFIINDPASTFCVFSHLLRSGYRIPGNYAIISLTEAKYYTSLSPSVAFYTRPNFEMAKRTIDYAMRLSKGLVITKPEYFIVPEFVPGESLGQRVQQTGCTVPHSSSR